MTPYDALLLGLYIIAGWLLGWSSNRWLMPALVKVSSKTETEVDDLVISSIRKWTIPWLTATGLFIGLRRISMDQKYHDWLEHGLMIFFIFSVTLIAGKVVAGLVRIKAKGTDTVIPSSSIISNIIRTIIFILGLLLILQSLGISVTPLLTALGVGGLAVALALQDTLSNLFAGVQIIASGKINPGDFVKLDNGAEGFVEDITWRTTTIRAVADHIIVVPNSKLSNMIVTNFNLPKREIAFAVELGVSYGSNLEKVEAVTKEVIYETLQESEGAVKDFEPIVRFFAFGESSINLRAIFRVEEYTQQHAVRHLFIKKLQDRYRKEGIEIPFPMRTVILKNETGAAT
ncbi:MAG: mechanosensitive ion channel family protein [Lacibacter sp.]